MKNQSPQRHSLIMIITLMGLSLAANGYFLGKQLHFLAQPLPSNTLADYHADAYSPERYQILLYLEDNFRNWRLAAPSEEFLDEDLYIIPLMFIEAGGQVGIDYHGYDPLLTDDEAAGLMEHETVWFENGGDIDIYVVFSDEPEVSKTNWLAMYNHSLYIIPQSLVPARMRE